MAVLAGVLAMHGLSTGSAHGSGHVVGHGLVGQGSTALVSHTSGGHALTTPSADRADADLTEGTSGGHGAAAACAIALVGVGVAALGAAARRRALRAAATWLAPRRRVDPHTWTRRGPTRAVRPPPRISLRVLRV